MTAYPDDLPKWVEKLSVACSRGDDAQCEWQLCGCPCHDEPKQATP